jgi:hypothetical protein
MQEANYFVADSLERWGWKAIRCPFISRMYVEILRRCGVQKAYRAAGHKNFVVRECVAEAISRLALAWSALHQEFEKFTSIVRSISGLCESNVQCSLFFKRL